MKRKYIKLFLWIFLLCVLSAGGIFNVGSITPDLLLVFVVCYAFCEEQFGFALGVGILCGVLMGALGGRGFGFTVLLYTYASLLCYGISEKKGKKSWAGALICVVLLTALSEGLFYLFRYITVIDASAALFATILPAVVYNGLWSCLLFQLIKGINKKKVFFAS